MAAKTIPFTQAQLNTILSKHATPFHIYDEKAMKVNALRLRDAFAWNPGFKEYFAVKAAPNPFLMKILKETTTIDPNMAPIIVGFDESALFDYPIVYVCEPGY